MDDEKKYCGCCSTTHHILTALTILAMVGLLYLNLTKPIDNRQPAVNHTIEVKQPDYQRDTLTVSGNAQLTVSPDKAEIYISIVSDNKTAKLAQENNRVVANAVMAALKAHGIDASDIETETYYLARLEDGGIRDYDAADIYSGKDRIVDRGYRLTHTIKATIRQIDKVGDVIDATVRAGANGIESVVFGLTEESENRTRAEAMVKAVEAAKEKAKKLSQAAEVDLGKVTVINEQSFYYTPYGDNTRGNLMLDGSHGETLPPTAISPQKVEVTSSVLLVYNIK